MAETRRTKLPERNLDVLRAIAVLCVVVFHIIIATGIKPALWSWLGRIGVLIFFVHTSLVLMGSLERAGARKHWLRDFYVRRAFRIYPLAMIVVLAVVVARMPYPVPVFHLKRIVSFTPPGVWMLVSNLTLTQNIAGQQSVLSVLWTLPLELQMYVVLPACWLLARRSVLGVVTLTMVAVVSAITWLRFHDSVAGLWRVTTIEFVPCFLAGVLAYAILRRDTRAHAPGVIWPGVVLASLVCYWIMAKLEIGAAAEWVVCLMIGIAIPLVRELSASALTSAAAVVAKYSYGVYLLHLPALWIAFTLLHGQSTSVQWITALGLMIALPWLGYHLVERPGIQVGKRATLYRGYDRSVRLRDGTPNGFAAVPYRE